jgi:hypothetical protein
MAPIKEGVKAFSTLQDIFLFFAGEQSARHLFWLIYRIPGLVVCGL